MSRMRLRRRRSPARTALRRTRHGTVCVRSDPIRTDRGRATIDGVRYVDDSKATNPRPPHRLRRTPASSGSRVASRRVPPSTSFVRGAAARLRGAVLLGQDRTIVEEALRRHAPDVPVIEVVALKLAM